MPDNPAVPRKLPPDEVLATARACIAKDFVRHSRHFVERGAERQIEDSDIVEAIDSPHARIDGTRTTFDDTLGNWSYRIESKVAGHKFRVVVAFVPPPLPEIDVMMLIVTALFPNEPGGARPKELP